jgi:hypothetical protein
MTQENYQGNSFTKAKAFWDSQSLLAKHLLAGVLAFFLLPVFIVVGKLGFKQLSEFLMLLDASLIFWASGFWYLFKGILRGLGLAVFFD